MAQVSGWVWRSVRAAAADDDGRGGSEAMLGWAEVGGGGGGEGWLLRLAIWTSCFREDARNLACALSLSWTIDPTNMAWSWRSVALNSWTVWAAARERAAFLASAVKC